MPRAPLEQRFWSRVQKTPDCWLWTGGIWSKDSRHGYGCLWNDEGKREQAHRLSMRLHGFTLSRDQHIHHLCENRLCVKPEHLLVVSNSEHPGFHAVWDKEKVISALRRFVSEQGRPIAATDCNVSAARKLGQTKRVALSKESGLPSLFTVQQLFGSWSAAIAAAGLPKAKSGRPPGSRSGSTIY